MTDTPTSTRSLGEDARHEVRDAKSRLSRGLHEARTQAPSALRAMATDLVDSKRSQFSADLHALAGALRRSKDRTDHTRPAHLSTQGEDVPNSRLAGHAANAIDAVAKQLDNRSAADIARLVATYGRTKPGLFVGGCILAGLALGRVLTAKDTAHDDRGLYDSQDPLYDQPARTRASSTGTYTPAPSTTAPAPSATAAAPSSEFGRAPASPALDNGANNGATTNAPTTSLHKGDTHARP